MGNKRKLIVFLILISTVSLLWAFSLNQNEKSSLNGITNKFIVGETDFRFWQGVASDGDYLYMTSDRNENFELENIISVYSLEGEYIKEKRNAYTKKDSNDHFMSFGDSTVIDGYLYAPVYNINGGGPEPYESRIIVFDLETLDIIKEYDIGDGVAESVVKNKNSFWVVYHDKKEVRQFDENFSSYQTYNLGQNFELEGGYQGVIFKGNDLYVNLHGANNFNGDYAYGLDHYKFKNGKFEFVERIKPPTYGSGQGIDYVDGYYLWTDRPSNQIIVTKEIDIWN